MQTHGTYFDGQVSVGRPATLTFAPEGVLRIEGEGFFHELPLAQLRVSDRLGDVPRFLYLPGGASVETPDNATLDAALAHRPRERLSRLIHFLESQQRIAAVACILLALAVVTIGYYAPPALARVVAHRVPAQVDQRLGELSLASVEGFLKPSYLNAHERARVQRQLDRVLVGTTLKDVRLEFRSMYNGLPNAFALPGNVVVMTDQLVRLPATDDELAAVLAHELGHLERRHVTQTILRESFALLLVAAITGDLSTLTSFIGTIPVSILGAGYSRDLEREADHYALDRLRACGIPPQAFASVMEQLDAAYDRVGRGNAGWMSTHPESEERIALFGKLTDADREAFALSRTLLDSDSLHAQAAASVASQDHAAALKIYDRLLARAPDLRTYTLRATSHRAEGDLPAAERDIAAALQLDPAAPEARALEIELLSASDRLAEALTRAQAFQRDAPASSTALALLGWVELRQGQIDSARARFDQALALDPADYRPWAFRGYLKVEHDRQDGRLDLDRALELAPHRAWVRYTRGKARNRAGDHLGALQDFNAISEKRLLGAFYYQERAYAQTKMHAYARAVGDYDLALKHTLPPGERSTVLQSRAYAHLHLGDPRAAIVDYTEALRLTPAATQLLTHRARAHAHLRQFPAAIADLDRFLAQSPAPEPAARLSALRDRALAAWDGGQLDAALRDYDRLLTESPSSGDFHDRGILHLVRADYSRAEADLRAALITGQGDRAYTHFFHLIASRRAGRDYDLAAFSARVDTWPAGWPRSVGLYLAGRLGEAAFLAEASIGSDPSPNERRCEAYYYLGEQHRHAGATQYARDYFEKSTATGATTYSEYRLAQAELTRLR